MTMSKASQRELARLEESTTHALEVLTRLGVDHAEVSVSSGERLELDVRNDEIELVKEARSSGMSVRVIRDGRVSTSATTDLTPGAVEAFLARTLEMAELSEEDPLAAPPDPEELDGEWQDLDLFDPAVLRLDAKKALSMARKAERAAFAADRRITASDGASVGRSVGHSVLGTTGGFLQGNAGTSAWLGVHVIADDEGGKKRNGYEWTGGRHMADFEDPREVGRMAAHKAVRSLGARKIPTGVMPVVFDRDAAGSILGLLASCVVGDAVHRKQSYLEKRLGTQVASPLVTIVDDPLIPRAPGSRGYDGEGRKTRRNVVVKGGVLESFLLDTYSARKLKMAPTRSAAGGGGIPHSSTSNFVFKNGRKAPEKLLVGIERGLYVTSMMGFGFDPITGNFSRGASGFLVEHGELTIPVAEITISRNLDDLLRGIDAVGNDLRLRTATASPSFRVDAMTISGR